MPKSGITMTGPLIAQSNTNYTTPQVRNIIMSTSAPTAADGKNGDIWIQYSEWGMIDGITYWIYTFRIYWK